MCIVQYGCFVVFVAKIADNITVIPFLELCLTTCSEINVKGLNHEWETFLVENVLLMDVIPITVENFYVLFPKIFDPIHAEKVICIGIVFMVFL